jgi:uncharacterized protein (TIGR02145 family)
MFIFGIKIDNNSNNLFDNKPTAGGIVTDIDGNTYHTLTLGKQVWMVENLRVTHYRDGSKIHNITNNKKWSRLTSGAYCWYENNPAAYKDTYGALYNFPTINDPRGLCPEGWHVPTKSDWLTLEAYLGGRKVSGGKMKEAGSTHWNSPNIGATNESGFTGLPGGGRARLGWFGDVGEYATWWSSTQHDSTSAWHWGLSRKNAGIRANPGHSASGFYVRCVKD